MPALLHAREVVTRAATPRGDGASPARRPPATGDEPPSLLVGRQRRTSTSARLRPYSSPPWRPATWIHELIPFPLLLHLCLISLLPTPHPQFVFPRNPKLLVSLLLLLVKLLVYAVHIDEVSLIDEVQFLLMKCSSCCFACMQKRVDGVSKYEQC